jgi:hypothetical protein
VVTDFDVMVFNIRILSTGKFVLFCVGYVCLVDYLAVTVPKKLKAVVQFCFEI